MAKENYEEMSKEILEQVGGSENVTQCSHCVTRLRLNVKDKSQVNEEALGKISGVIGSQWLGEQLQIILGTEVENIYPVFCQVGGFEQQAAVDENLDTELTTKKKFSLSTLGNNIMGYLSPTMTGIIPLMMAACLCETINALLGPSMLNVISETSDLYFTLDLLYNAFFYFIPLILGYSAAKTLNINPIYGIYMGAIIIAPQFMALIDVRETVSIFGIPAPVADYSTSFLPVILGVWILSYVLKLWNRVIPDVLKNILVPLLTVVVMTPIMFVICAPLGTYIGNVVGNFFISMAEANVVLSVIAAVLLAALMPYMVLTGMHGALLSFALVIFTTNGVETLILPIMLAYNFAVFGVALGAGIKLKKPEHKVEVFGYFLTGILGSVTEPCLYGVIMKYRRTMRSLLIACVVAGLIVGIFVPQYYVMASATAFTFWIPWVQGGTTNLVVGVVLMVLTFVVGMVAALFEKYDED